MPQVFKMGPYLVYFWSNENEPLEPVKKKNCGFMALRAFKPQFFALTSGPLARTRPLTRGGGGEAPEAQRPASSAARSSAQAQDANRN